jgi:HEAT repeat protein
MLWWELRRLKSSKSDVRRDAASRLQLRKDRSAIGPLLDALADGDQSVRVCAEKALDSTDPDWRTNSEALSAVPHLIQRLNGNNAQEVSAAASALAKIRDSRALLPLALKLTEVTAEGPYWTFAVHPETLARMNARWYELSEVKPVIRKLLDMMRSEKPADRVHASKVLGSVPGHETEVVLAGSVKDPEPSVRESVLYSLSALGWKEPQFFFQALNDTEETVRSAAVHCLDNIKWKPENEEQRIKYARQRYRMEDRTVAVHCFFCKTPLINTVQRQRWQVELSHRDTEASLLSRTNYDAEICFHCLTVGCTRCVRGKTCLECGKLTTPANEWQLRELRNVAWGVVKREG